jgi:hypothetical protein
VENARIARIEFGILEGQRPRHAGSNARLGDHGLTVRVPLARLTTDDGAQGFGVFRGSQDDAAAFLGASLAEAFAMESGTAEAARAWDYPLWDLMAKRAGEPVYALAAAVNSTTPPTPYRAPCYDTSLYFDDLHLDSDDEAAALIAAEAREGYERGHRAFKIKVGRGARPCRSKPGHGAISPLSGQCGTQSAPVSRSCWTRMTATTSISPSASSARRQIAASTGWKSPSTKTPCSTAICTRGCNRKGCLS